MKSTPKYPLQVGCIVECINNDKIILAIIEEIKGTSYYLYTNTNREIKVNENRLLPWYGPCYPVHFSRTEYTKILQKELKEREDIKNSLNIPELWECIANDVIKVKVEELAQLLTNSPQENYISALGRALLEYKDYFKFFPPYFEVYTKEFYENKKLLRETQEKKQQELKALTSIIQHAVHAIQKETSIDIESLDIDTLYIQHFIELFHAKITYTASQEQEKLWKEITHEIKDQDTTFLVLIGQALQLIPPHYNTFANSVGYALENWEEKYKEEIIRLSSPQYTYEKIDTPFISIDNESTRDIDDAFYLEKDSEGKYSIHFAIALPVESWDYTSDLHKEVYTRATSLYLPEQTYNMLPTILAEDIYSINANEEKNILYLNVTTDAHGKLLETDVAIRTAMIHSNSTYKAIEEQLEDACGERHWLHDAYNLATRLQNKRLQNGGILIQREDIDISLQRVNDNYRVDITTPQSYPQSQLLVSEFMILANMAIVDFAKKHHIPLIHRVQECSTPTGNQRIWERPEEIHGVMKMLTSVSLDVLPKRHSALGILGYATITSPLRRMVDFINEEQIFSWIQHKEARYSEDSLSAMIPLIQRHTEQSLSIQRFRTRYWKLCYLKQYEGQWITGIFVEESMFISLYIPSVQLTVKVKPSLCGNKCILGESIELRYLVNPLQNDLSIVEIR